MADKRWIYMIRLLYQSEGGLSIKDLSQKTDLSPKTVKSILEQNQEQSELYGFRFGQTGAGLYQINVFDSTLFSPNILLPGRSYGGIGASPDRSTVADEGINAERVDYILSRLLAAADYVKIESLADEMYTSRATIDRLMPELKDRIGDYGLCIESRPHLGVRIDGTEICKRICYAHCANVVAGANRQEAAFIQEVLLTTLKRYRISLNDINIYNLVHHCMVMVERIRSGHALTEFPIKPLVEPEESERAAAREIAERLQEKFSVSFSEAECKYLTMHLMSKRGLHSSDAVRPQVLSDVEAILEEIYQTRGLDLRDDEELQSSLALHIQPLLTRLSMGLKQSNPALREIRQNLSDGYSLALCATQVLFRRYGLLMDEDEVGFLAMHFALSLERQANAQEQEKILVVCASGRGALRLLQYRLISCYHFDVERMVAVSAFQLESYDFSNVMCILSTLPLPKSYPVPTILVDLTLNAQSQKRITDFLQSRHQKAPAPSAGPENESGASPADFLLFPSSSLQSKGEIIHFLCQQICAHWDLPQDLEEQILKLERLTTTEVGNQLAILQPYLYTGHALSFSVLVLREPIWWKYQTIRMVILATFPHGVHEAQQLYQRVAEFARDQGKIKKLLEAPTEGNIRRLFFEG